MDKRKTGIALFITLMVIASIMSIIAVSFSYLEKVQKDAGATSALIQANLLYGNTVDILKRFFPKGTNNNEKLALLYTMPLLIDESKSAFSLSLVCQPLMIGTPINWLDYAQNLKVPDKAKIANEVLENIMELYEIEDPDALQEMLLKEISGRPFRNNNYKIRIKKQKGINSKQQFDKILLDYAFLYDDQKALNVPWDKYFAFVTVNSKTKIDGNYLSAEFISVAFDVPIEIVQDNWIMGESTLSSFLSENGIIAPINNKIYANKAMNAMLCEERFAYQEQQYTFKFNYIEGRSSNFEFNGQE